MEDKLVFLRKYKDNVYILSVDEVDNIGRGLIPDIWREISKEVNIRKKIDKMLLFWKKNFSYELRNTISYLSEYLENIEVIKIYDRYSLLYTIKNERRDSIYYEGRNPRESFNNQILENSWDMIPRSLRGFYETLHNGFYYYSSESMGLVPLESVTYLDDYEWGIIEELKEPLQVDLKTSFGFFGNGMGDHVVIDCSNCLNENASLWFHDDQPEYNLNFWNVVDEWMVLGFQT